MNRTLLIAAASLFLTLAGVAHGQSSLGPNACPVPAILPSVPSPTAQVVSFNAAWFPTGGDNETFSAILWREVCPSNPAASILYLRYTPTSGTPLACPLAYSVFQNSVQYSNLQFLQSATGAGFCAPLAAPATFVLGSLDAPFFDPSQALILVYQGAGPGLSGNNVPVQLPAAGTAPAAIAPTVGLWWNPSESGSGYALDYKHGVLVVTVYSYTAAGAPIWYLAAGPVTANNFSATLDKYQGGQCIGCAYKPAAINGNDGAITINFTSSTTATMGLPGGRSFQIVPQAF